MKHCTPLVLAVGMSAVCACERGRGVVPQPTSTEETVRPRDNLEGRVGAKTMARQTRTCGGMSIVATVDTSTTPRAGAIDGLASALAGASAWLALARKNLAEGRAHVAMECARSGIEELGENYADEATEDDTSLKLAAAQERAEQGHWDDGAAVMTRILQERVHLYMAKNRLPHPTVNEPDVK